MSSFIKYFENSIKHFIKSLDDIFSHKSCVESCLLIGWNISFITGQIEFWIVSNLLGRWIRITFLCWMATDTNYYFYYLRWLSQINKQCPTRTHTLIKSSFGLTEPAAITGSGHKIISLIVDFYFRSTLDECWNILSLIVSVYVRLNITER